MTKVKLSDVVRRCQTKVNRYDTDLTYFVAGEHFDSGEMELNGRGEVAGSTIGPMFYYGFKPGDFLLVSRNPHLKKASRVEFAGICSEKTFVLESADENVLLSEYLPWVLQNDSFWDYAQKNRHGSTNSFINWSTLADYEFDLPKVGDQARMSELLWAAQDLRRNYRSLLVACDDVVKSQFVEMFGDLRFNNKLMPIRALNEVASSRLGKMLDSKHQTGEWRRPYLTNRNVQWFRFDFQEVNSMDFPPADQKEFSLLPGDLLVCEGGEVGRCAIWRGQMKDCYFQKALHRVRCGNAIIPEYLCWWFKMMADEGLLTRHANTATITHLSGVQLKQLGVLVPPLSLQQEFADFVAQVDKSKFAVQKALDELNATTKKILNQELGLGDV